MSHTNRHRQDQKGVRALRFEIMARIEEAFNDELDELDQRFAEALATYDSLLRRCQDHKTKGECDLDDDCKYNNVTWRCMPNDAHVGSVQHLTSAGQLLDVIESHLPSDEERLNDILLRLR